MPSKFSVKNNKSLGSGNSTSISTSSSSPGSSSSRLSSPGRNTVTRSKSFSPRVSTTPSTLSKFSTQVPQKPVVVHSSTTVQTPTSSTGPMSSKTQGKQKVLPKSSSGIPSSSSSSGIPSSSSSSDIPSSSSSSAISSSKKIAKKIPQNPGDIASLMDDILQVNPPIEVNLCNGEKVPLAAYVNSFWHNPSFQQILQLNKTIDTIKFIRSVGGNVQLQKLLHGTSDNVSEKILSNGFVVGSRAAYGPGIYLTNSSMEAASYARDAITNLGGNPVIMECLVLIMDVPYSDEFKHLCITQSMSEQRATELTYRKPMSVLTLVESDTSLMTSEYERIDSFTFCQRITRSDVEKNRYYSDPANALRHQINTPRQSIPFHYGPGYSIYSSRPGTYVFVICMDLSLLLAVNSTPESLFLNVDPIF